MSNFSPVLVLAIVAAVAFPAHAGDEKIYPAFLCEETGSAPSGSIHRSEYRVTKSSGSLESTTVHCPVLRDSFSFKLRDGDTNVAAIKSASVDVVDAMIEADVSCAFVGPASDGSSLFYQSRRTSGASSDVQALSFDLALAVLGSDKNFYAIDCSLPRNLPPQVAKIISYRVVEY